MAGGGLPAVRRGSPEQGGCHASLPWVFPAVWTRRCLLRAVQEKVESPFFRESSKVFHMGKSLTSFEKPVQAQRSLFGASYCSSEGTSRGLSFSPALDHFPLRVAANLKTLILL